jgi:hypothetical protein
VPLPSFRRDQLAVMLIIAVIIAMVSIVRLILFF